MNRRAAIVTLISAAAGFCSTAEAAELGPKQIALLILRVLAYDRNLKTRSDGKTASIVVLFQEGNQASESLQIDMENALEDLSSGASISGLAVKATSYAYANPAALDARLASLRAVAVFVCSGLGDAIPHITAVVRKRSVLSFTLNTAFVKGGLSIGFANAEDRVHIVVNLPAYRAEGADLDASLLRIADLYR